MSPCSFNQTDSEKVDEDADTTPVFQVKKNLFQQKKSSIYPGSLAHKQLTYPSHHLNSRKYSNNDFSLKNTKATCSVQLIYELLYLRQKEKGIVFFCRNRDRASNEF